ncbi:PAP2 superfamily [Legionella beliardensis]|uniref:undecaprenyl-diphosphate phosphatase n=1 Tax=Legionella beliardensis TaxID=91822 RepID=A0A378I3G1_9GAMM|nr:phosphatase PAP2 family protein [Legionella beliardensis]STX29709.1 PAP2 superfamily [Legionella beliardensis]
MSKINKAEKKYFLIGGICCLFLFLFLTAIVFYKLPFLSINDALYVLVHKIQSPFTDYLGNFISLFGNKYIVIPTIVITSLILFIKQQKRLALHLLVAIVIAAVCASILKNTIVYLRPAGAVADSLTYAFPSRHVTLSSTYIVFLAALIIPQMRRPWLGLVIACLSILLEAAARILLEVHWLTDVIGGFLLGAACGLLSAYSFYLKPNTIVNYKALFTTLLIVFFIISACYLFILYLESIS